MLRNDNFVLPSIHEDNINLVVEQREEFNREIGCRTTYGYTALSVALLSAGLATYFEISNPSSVVNTGQASAIDLVCGLMAIASLFSFREAFRFRSYMSCQGLFAQRRNPELAVRLLEDVDLDGARISP